MKIKSKQLDITNGKLVVGSSTATTETSFTFPASDGSENQVLQTNGSGTVSWATISSGSTTSISDADGDTKVQVEESSDEDKIRFDTAGSERMIITDDGKVGIGTSTPSRKLDVDGSLLLRNGNISRTTSGTEAITIDLSNNLTVGNDLTVDGNGSSSGVTITDGSIAIRTGTGNVAQIDMYCEVNNLHKVSLKAPAHSAFSGNLNFVLPPSHGNNGQYLKTDGSGNTSWGTVSGGGGGSLPTVTNVTSADVGSDNYTISSVSGLETTFLINYSITGSTSIVYLPSTAGVSSGYKINIKRLIAKAVTLSVSSGTTEKIDTTNTTISIPYQYSSITVQTDGSNWFII